MAQDRDSVITVLQQKVSALEKDINVICCRAKEAEQSHRSSHHEILSKYQTLQQEHAQSEQAKNHELQLLRQQLQQLQQELAHTQSTVTLSQNRTKVMEARLQKAHTQICQWDRLKRFSWLARRRGKQRLLRVANNILQEQSLQTPVQKLFRQLHRAVSKHAFSDSDVDDLSEDDLNIQRPKARIKPVTTVIPSQRDLMSVLQMQAEKRHEEELRKRQRQDKSGMVG